MCSVESQIAILQIYKFFSRKIKIFHQPHFYIYVKFPVLNLN
jgi:hypothetical protein